MKTLILSISFILIGLLLQAQVKYGIKAGVNFYQVKGRDAGFYEENQKFKLGLSAGVFVDIPLSGIFNIQTELLYSSEGNFQRTNAAYKSTLKLGYINVPILFQYNVSGFYAESGPQVGFLTSAKSVLREGDNEIINDYKNAFIHLAVAWSVGLGFRMANGFGAGWRYNVGLSSISNRDFNYKTDGFNAHLFYIFGSR